MDWFVAPVFQRKLAPELPAFNETVPPHCEISEPKSTTTCEVFPIVNPSE